MRRAGLALVFLAGLAAQAQVPQRLGYQGRLTAMDGTPVTGPQAFTFELFVGPTGGTPLWSETQTVLVTNGLYAATLGDVSSCDAGTCAGLPPSLFTGAELYLEVSVGGAPMVPRQRVTSVPYALRARDVAGGTAAVSSATVSGDLSVAGIARVGSLRTSGGAPIIDTTGKYVGPAVVSAPDGGGVAISPAGAVTLAPCPSGQALRSSGTSWACAAVPTPDTNTVYQCPSREDAACGTFSTHTCLGQLTTSATCTARVQQGLNCQYTQVNCSAVGRLVTP